MTDDQPTAAYPEAPVGSAGPPPPPPGAGAGAGDTWIADGIVAKVATAAAREVDGVEGLRGGGPRRGWVRASERTRGGATVRIDDGVATISMRLVVRDGVPIPALIDTVRARVIERVEFATGMSVTRVDIGVVDVTAPPPPQPEADAEATAQAQAPPAPPTDGGDAGSGPTEREAASGGPA